MDVAALFVQPKSVNELPRSQRNATNPYDYNSISAIMSYVQEEHAAYKFTVYRCASKIVSLQKLLFTANIPYKLVQALLERYGIRDEDANFMVPPFQLTTFVHDLYHASESLGHFSKLPSYRLETATSVLASFFWNIFDPNRHHSISVLEIKVMFLLLCKLHTSTDLSAEFYNLLHDPKTKCVSKKNFEYLLNILIKTFCYIGEESAYGAQNKMLVMDQCFAKSHNLYGLTEFQFCNLWGHTHTRFSIYSNLVTLIKRIEDTEKLIHTNNCASCSKKIIGIRFKCRTCHDLSLCLPCFATGYVTSKHQSGHRMYEMFTEDVSPKNISHFFANMCNILCISKQSNEETKGFCNTNESTSADDTELETITTVNTSTNLGRTTTIGAKIDPIERSIAGLSTSASTASNVSEHLQSIIDRLLQQNSKLEKQIQCVKTATCEEISEFLQAHQHFLIGIINEMRRFSQISKSLSSYPTSSTPNRSSCAKAVTSEATNPADSYNTGDRTLTHSINGADLNRSYLDANKTDISINDLSSWFNQKRTSTSVPMLKLNTAVLEVVSEDTVNPNQAECDEDFEIVDVRDTDMLNFKVLLRKVKEIVEDSFSDNTELAAATQNLENVLDSIVRSEEKRRSST